MRRAGSEPDSPSTAVRGTILGNRERPYGKSRFSLDAVGIMDDAIEVGVTGPLTGSS